jgi:PTH1 family peptidyl-tRNA hydrolase
MKLIVGLGNPGKKYEKTRHNIGWRAVDAFTAKWHFEKTQKKFEAEIVRGKAFNEDIILMKPQTFMNLSGSAVSMAVSFYKIPLADLWVIHDEIDLAVDSLRVRLGGSSGGHNGVGSIIERLNAREFHRFRIGVGRPADETPVADYVLQPFGKLEEIHMREVLSRVVLAMNTALSEGMPKAMTIYNH